MSDFQPIPVFVKQGQIEQLIQQWDERAAYFQAVVNRYKALNVTSPLLENDLVEMMNNPKEFIVKKITEGNEFNLGDMKLDAAKVFDLLEKPLGSVEFIEFIEASKKQESPEKWYYRHAYLFTITNGLVKIKPDELEKITTQNTVFLRSQKDKDIYDLLSSLCDSINSLNELKRIYNIDEKLFTQLIQTNPATEIVSVREDFLRIFNG